MIIETIDAILTVLNKGIEMLKATITFLVATQYFCETLRSIFSE